MGEKCLWHFARKPSPESYAFLAEVSGPQNVGESQMAPQLKNVDVFAYRSTFFYLLASRASTSFGQLILSPKIASTTLNSSGISFSAVA